MACLACKGDSNDRRGSASDVGATLRSAADAGRRFTEASQSNATPLFTLCSSSLVFGLWDSTSLNPKAGQGAKFQRAIVSEIVGVGVELGTRTSSRIDPAGIEKTEIYEAKRSIEGQKD